MVWSTNLAYAVGLIATDGCLSKNGRNITIVSKDLDQLYNFSKALEINCRIGRHSSSYNPSGLYYHLQFSNVKLYRFLLEVGLTPNKTKTIGVLRVPSKFFADFLRGHLDGDGYTYSYFDPRWKGSFMLYTSFVSASRSHLIWIAQTIEKLYGIKGKISLHNSVSNLRFAKKASVSLLKKIYYKKGLTCLERKRFKIQLALDIIHKSAGVAKLVAAYP